MPSALNFIFSMLLIFFVFAILVSNITEIWNSTGSRRASCLWRGVGQMLGTDETGARLLDELKSHPAIVALGSQAGQSPSYLPSELFASALIDVLMARGASAPRPPQEGIGDALTLLAGESQASKVLRFLWRRAGADLLSFQSQLATYYDQLMDRVSGWYKRGSSKRCFVVGLACAIVLNIDAVHLGRALWNDPHLAQRYADNGERLVVDYGKLALENDAAAGERVIRQGLASELPIGWPARWYAELSAPGQDIRPGLLAAEIAWTCVGYLIMAWACMLGAPLWFQLLSSLLPLRMAGRVPARSDSALPAPAPARTDSHAPVRDAEGVNADDKALNYLERDLLENGQVKAVQNALGVQETGQFDLATRSAIHRRQGDYGFERTGQITRMLLNMLER